MEVQNKYTAAAMRALEEAARAAAAEGSEYVGTEYLLLGLTAVEEGTASVVLNSFDVTRESVSALVRELIDPRSQDGADGRKSPRKRGRKVSVKDPFSKLTPRSRMALRTAGEQAVYFFSKDVGTEHILLALMRDVDCNAAKLLHTKQVDFQAMYTKILDIIGVSDEQLSEYLQMVTQNAGGGSSPTPVLDQFSRDMTYAVREGKIDPIIGRDAETERICQILAVAFKGSQCRRILLDTDRLAGKICLRLNSAVRRDDENLTVVDVRLGPGVLILAAVHREAVPDAVDGAGIELRIL